MIEQTTHSHHGRRDQHAVYANCRDARGERLTFRVGQPTDWPTAQDRWLRLDDRRRALVRQALVRQAIRWARRRYTVENFEVRTVNRHGQGLGAERHAAAIPVPYRSCR